MTKNPMNTIGGIVLILMGLWFAISHKRLGLKTSDFYYRLLKVRYSEKYYQLGFLVGGILGIVFGLLAAFQIIPFQRQ